MHSMVFSSTRPGLSASQVQALDSQLGGGLSNDYKAFLSVFNGGVPELGYFYADWLGEDLWIDWFCWVDENLAAPVHCAEYDSLSFARYKYSGMVPEDTLIIGRCCRDDLLLLGLAGARHGQVLYKDIAHLPGGDRAVWRERKDDLVSSLAGSFGAFLKCLKDEED
ncbi:SMI1/KNR4 family protein [Posidoniimonas polymericola]|uniref:SMI1/KNR4 family protein n=1 Tax=Posidoniimonas polymericola TaxID=2528002 RepID=UPI0011B6723D|nr:SMI1/KNR4 family protein [Posidoniimonas polymericola]